LEEKEMPKADFFISYTKVDEEWAKWIAWELKKQGFTSIVQAYDFHPGGNFIQQMRKAINTSRQTVAVLSPEYLRSNYATAELNAAIADDPLGEKGKLVPVRVRECRPKDLMRDRVYIDLVNKSQQAARRDLIAGIRASQLSINRNPIDLQFKVKPKFPTELNVPTAQDNLKTSVGGAIKPPPLPLRILFLASEAGTGLNLRGQFKEIKAAIARSSLSSSIRVKGVFDLTAEKFFEALNSYTPHILHFSGKQDGGDILINSENGGVTTISDIALAGLLKSLDDHIRLVIVDTCSSWRCAKSVSNVVECAIGVRADIYEEDANRFYVALYRSLASGRSVKDAWGQANAAPQFKQVPQKEIPQLCVRRGVDPSKLILASKRATKG
jgi:hypothetical protein